MIAYSQYNFPSKQLCLRIYIHKICMQKTYNAHISVALESILIASLCND